MSLYAALKVALPILNALPKDAYVALAKMAGDLPPDMRRSLTGVLDSGLSEEEAKSLSASVKRVDKKHLG